MVHRFRRFRRSLTTSMNKRHSSSKRYLINGDFLFEITLRFVSLIFTNTCHILSQQFLNHSDKLFSFEIVWYLNRIESRNDLVLFKTSFEQHQNIFHFFGSFYNKYSNVSVQCLLQFTVLIKSALVLKESFIINIVFDDF